MVTILAALLSSKHISVLKFNLVSSSWHFWNCSSNLIIYYPNSLPNFLKYFWAESCIYENSYLKSLRQKDVFTTEQKKCNFKYQIICKRCTNLALLCRVELLCASQLSSLTTTSHLRTFILFKAHSIYWQPQNIWDKFIFYIETTFYREHNTCN